MLFTHLVIVPHGWSQPTALFVVFGTKNLGCRVCC
ncbi:hypothetical protein LEMLEM_LOCUS20131 [Lemmus lemmus]